MNKHFFDLRDGDILVEIDGIYTLISDKDYQITLAQAELFKQHDNVSKIHCSMGKARAWEFRRVVKLPVPQVKNISIEDKLSYLQGQYETIIKNEQTVIDELGRQSIKSCGASFFAVYEKIESRRALLSAAKQTLAEVNQMIEIVDGN